MRTIVIQPFLEELIVIPMILNTNKMSQRSTIVLNVFGNVRQTSHDLRSRLQLGMGLAESLGRHDSMILQEAQVL